MQSTMAKKKARKYCNTNSCWLLWCFIVFTLMQVYRYFSEYSQKVATVTTNQLGYSWNSFTFVFDLV